MNCSCFLHKRWLTSNAKLNMHSFRSIVILPLKYLLDNVLKNTNSVSDRTNSNPSGYPSRKKRRYRSSISYRRRYSPPNTTGHSAAPWRWPNARWCRFLGRFYENSAKYSRHRRCTTTTPRRPHPCPSRPSSILGETGTKNNRDKW